MKWSKTKKKKNANFPLKHRWKTRSVQSRAEKNSQEKREYGELFTKNIGSGENTSGRKGGKICFGIMRLQTLRNSVSPNFIHFSHWIHGDTVHNLYPPPSMATTEIHSVDAMSRLLVHPRVARTKEEYWIRGGGGREGISQEEKHEGRRKRETLGNARCTNRILVFFVFLERFLEKLSLRVGSLLVLGRALRSNRVSRQRISMIFPNATQSGSFDRLAEGDRGRLPCGFTPRAIHTSWNNKIVDVAWKWRNLSYIYIRMRYRKGKRWLLNLAIFWNNLRL